MPLNVTFLLFGEARDVAGARFVNVELEGNGSDVPSMLGLLDAATGRRLSGRVLVMDTSGTFSVAPGYKIMINKRIMTLQELRSVMVKAGDEIGLLPPFSGG